LYDPQVSIIILNWNGLRDTIECLESLRRISYPNYNVFLVDNASAGNDVAVLREKFGDYLHIIQNDQNYGFAKGNNIGIRYALEMTADYVLLLNNDTVVDPSFLDELVGVAEADKIVGIACPVIYWYHQPDQIWFSGQRKVNLFRGTITPDRQMDVSHPVLHTEFATGAAMLIRADTIRRLGFLPEDYLFGVEDIDYSLRVLRQGLKIAVVARAKVWHKGSGSSAGITTARVGYHYSGWQMLRREHLSSVGYVLATVCGFAWASIQFSILFLGYLRHGDRHSICTLFQKTAQAVRGIFQGSF